MSDWRVMGRLRKSTVASHCPLPRLCWSREGAMGWMEGLVEKYAFEVADESAGIIHCPADSKSQFPFPGSGQNSRRGH